MFEGKVDADGDDNSVPDWVILDDSDVYEITRALASLDPKDIRLALRILTYASKNTRNVCPVCREPWHYDDCRMDEAEVDSGFVVYRLLNEEGRVLYVGSTRNFKARMKAHRRNWGRLFTSVITEQYPTAQEMLEAESLAIRNEQPPLNQQGIG